MSKYDFQKIEKKWQKKWLEDKTYEPGLNKPKGKGKFYNLMMFPYPSAEGLHVGNMYAFTGADIYGRFKRMQGYDVLEPIGLDGFGIHSENYALKIGAHPMDQAKISEKRFYKQLESIGNGFAWNEKVETYDPEYYKWTQWVFVQMFKKGLAYRKKASVNWCPSCKTVLADEQVVAGKCERCSSEVGKKELEQWFFKITDYAEKLLKNLEKIDWSEKVKIAQRHWVGKSEGALIKFQLNDILGQEDGKHTVEVFTTRPDTIFGATFIVVSPELAQKWIDIGWKADDEVKKYIKKSANKPEADRIAEGKEKTGVFAGIYAINPASKEKVPVWVADYVLGSYGTGAIMAVPAHDDRDWEFAKKYELQIKKVIESPVGFPSDKPYMGGGVVINSEAFSWANGLLNVDAAEEIVEELGHLGLAKKKTTYRLRDWLVSRQRYWSPPIPMIHCEKPASPDESASRGGCGWQPVPEKDLPVKLPYIKDFRPSGKGESPLASVKEFYKVDCPKCGGEARRETDVSDTFLDSAWYYLRYIDPKNKKEPFDKKIAKKWLPVDMYTGGAEHSVLHLLYSRFLGMVFTDWGLVDFKNGEPFPKFRAHGLLIKEGAKMSKSKGNVINPDEYIKNFGADTLRIYLMFIAPFEQGGDFRDSSILGIARFLERVWKLKPSEKNGGEKLINKTVKKITEDIEKLHYNTAISALMILLNDFEKVGVTAKQHETFLKLLAPLAPHITEELWRELGNKDSIHKAPWPGYDPKLIKEENFELIAQINGKMRGIINMKIGVSQKEAEEIALELPNVKEFIAGKKIKKTIFVKDRLINFVI